MDRNKLIKVVTAILVVVLLPYLSFGTNYYIDFSDGDDANSGTSLSTPWKSVSKVNNGIFLPGDSILFKRNEIWREQLIIPSSGEQDNPIVYGAYGEGNKPLFLGSDAKNSMNDWTFLGANKWATAVGSFPKLRWRSVGFMLLGEEKQENVGKWVAIEADLDMEREFWWEEANERVILYSPQGNPASVFSNIEIAHRHSCILLENKEHLVIQDLAFKYSNNSAIMPEACSHITIQNIEASFLGGGYGSTTRAGDAIPPHGRSSFIHIRNCNISQVFDIGIAPQLYPAESVTMHDIIVENCTIDRCGAGITIAAHGPVDAEIYNVYFRNNNIYNSGFGWSGTANSVHGKGISIKEKHGAIKPDVHDIFIENNIIDTYAFRGINAYEGNFVIKRNIVRNGTADYIDGTLDLPAALALSGGDYSSGFSLGEATGLIAYNLIYNNNCHGVYIKHNTPYPSERLEIYNNVFYNNGNSDYSNFRSRTSNGTILKNNIFYSAMHDHIEAGPFGGGTTVMNYNLYFSKIQTSWIWDDIAHTDFVEYQNYSGQDSASIFNDPQFVNPENYDFHLQYTSPAIDMGIDVGLSQDFDHNPVPLGQAPDLGAFEYDNSIGTKNIPDASDNGFIVFPNPSHDLCTIRLISDTSLTRSEIQVKIYSISGQILVRKEFEGNEIILNCSGFPSGIYIVKLEENNAVIGQGFLLIS